MIKHNAFILERNLCRYRNINNADLFDLIVPAYIAVTLVAFGDKAVKAVYLLLIFLTLRSCAMPTGKVMRRQNIIVDIFFALSRASII